MSPLSFYLSPVGRVSRNELWLKYLLPYWGIIFILAFVDGFIGTFNEESGLGLVSGTALVLSLWPSLAVCIKRMHDRDKSGWYLLTNLIPIWNIWSGIELYFLEGSQGRNRFGPDPKEKSTRAKTESPESAEAQSLIG